jgi:putative ABC transport system permease protein
MRIRDLTRLSVRALVVNKRRTALTMLGIVIGITSVILMVGVGQAAQRYLLSQVASFGSDMVFVANGRGDETRGGPPSQLTKQTLTVRDYEKLKRLSWPKAVNANFITRDLVSFGGVDLITQVSGSAPDELAIFNEVIANGRYIVEEDLTSRARVVVLGSKAATNLFGQEDPISHVVKISKQPFRVIGVLAPAGSRFFSDADEQVYIPFTAALDLYNKDRLNFLALRTGAVRPSEAKELVRIALRETHNIDNPENDLSKDDFKVASQEDAIKNADTIGSILQVLLGSIASISLVVAGVGIMNIMYVTVTERTREIGLRKAIGARYSDVLGQFLAEAVVLTVMAGVIGIVLGISFTWLAIRIILYFQGGWTFSIPWNGAAIGFLVSFAIGVIFGFFPARRAAKLNPIEALRYE